MISYTSHVSALIATALSGPDGKSATTQLASLLGSELGMALPSTLAFDFPTVEAIVAFVGAPPEPEQDTGARERRRSSFAHLFSLGGRSSLTDVFRRCATPRHISIHPEGPGFRFRLQSIVLASFCSVGLGMLLEDIRQAAKHAVKDTIRIYRRVAEKYLKGLQFTVQPREKISIHPAKDKRWMTTVGVEPTSVTLGKNAKWPSYVFRCVNYRR